MKISDEENVNAEKKLYQDYARCAKYSKYIAKIKWALEGVPAIILTAGDLLFIYKFNATLFRLERSNSPETKYLIKRAEVILERANLSYPKEWRDVEL